MSTMMRQLTELERAVRRARHVLRNPTANPALAAKYVAPLLAEFDRREDRIVAALALHPREIAGERAVCGWCRDGSEEPWEWPCPTVRALGGAS